MGCTLLTQPLQDSPPVLFKTELPRYFQHPYPTGKLYFHWLSKGYA